VFIHVHSWLVLVCLTGEISWIIMHPLTRRDFAGLTLALSAGVKMPLHAASLEAAMTTTLGASVQRHKIPAASAMVANADKTLYHGSFGHRDSASRVPITTRSIFRIASMTKPVTAVAAMQLVERGKLTLDDRVDKYLPELADLQVLEGFAADGHPTLRPAASPVLLRQLLTHTSGFAYDTWDSEQFRYSTYMEKTKAPAPPVRPLSFDPGTQWRYGTSMDWAGRLVEAVSGQTLEAWFQQEILQPLGMIDTSFICPDEKFDRLVNYYRRESNGLLKEQPRKPLTPPKSFNGGGGLYSTPEDYIRFMQMFLRNGQGAGDVRILRAETVDLMTKNHVGEMSAGKLKSMTPATSSDMDVHPGHTDGFGYGFLINAEDYDGGRSAGSLAWAGIDNTFFWIDPHRHLCALIMMQFLPFCDAEAVAVLRDFEHAIYSPKSKLA
jgi:CubicO group peptidase (beta-lactamase class C family)